VPAFRRQAPVVDDELRSIDQFKGCKKAQLREVARLAEQVKLVKGEILAREGQFARELFVILSGTVAITQKGRLMDVLGPGDFCGELAALTCEPRTSTATALSDLDLLIIGQREFDAMLRIPQFRDELLKRMASRLQTIDGQLASAVHGQTPEVTNTFHA
jgi:CRP/FNR family transcriptional regulator, cyclic AMP receptor protein